MPKNGWKPKDYSKGIIYKIVCKDPNITDLYAGSTLDFEERKKQHKWKCNSQSTRKCYDLRIYKFIREHGGWDNWEMIIVEYFSCTCKDELLEREGFHARELGATLNAYDPFGPTAAVRLRAKRAANASTYNVAWADDVD